MPRLLIEYQCPQCGAPAVLEETDRLFLCEYCRVKSYLLPKDFFRYVLPSTAPDNKDLVFFPYWRVKGMLFSCVEEGIEHKFIDVSHQAVKSRHFPISVGLRSQALKLNFVTPEVQGYFVKPTLPFKKMMDIVIQRFTTSPVNSVFHQSHVGESVSMIYSPFYTDNKTYDAVLNKPVTAAFSNGFDKTSFQGGSPDWRIHFTPALCPGCGWDLHGQRNSLVLSCKNCNSTWRAAGNRLKRLKFGCIPIQEKHVLYLPFWRIKADISGITLDSYADLVKVANLPKVVQNSWHDIEFRFWALGFKVRPRTFLRLARDITLSQPQSTLTKELPDDELYPVTLPIKEAVESLTITLAGFLKPKKDLVHKLRNITITPKSYLLVYIPFVEKNLDYIQPELNLAINRNQLALASNL